MEFRTELSFVTSDLQRWAYSGRKTSLPNICDFLFYSSNINLVLRTLYAKMSTTTLRKISTSSTVSIIGILAYSTSASRSRNKCTTYIRLGNFYIFNWGAVYNHVEIWMAQARSSACQTFLNIGSLFEMYQQSDILLDKRWQNSKVSRVSWLHIDTCSSNQSTNQIYSANSRTMLAWEGSIGFMDSCWQLAIAHQSHD